MEHAVVLKTDREDKDIDITRNIGKLSPPGSGFSFG